MKALKKLENKITKLIDKKFDISKWFRLVKMILINFFIRSATDGSIKFFNTIKNVFPHGMNRKFQIFEKFNFNEFYSRISEGKMHSKCKLSILEVKEIRVLLDSKISQREIAEKYNVSSATISNINRNITWKDV